MQISVGFFKPNVVVLPAGQPVRLVFYNNGGTPHDFVTRLFGAVDQRAGFHPGGTRVIVQVQERVEYDIVPRVPGTYALYSFLFAPQGGIQPARIEVR